MIQLNGFRQVSSIQKIDSGFRIQDSGLFSRTRNDSAKLIQLEMIQLNDSAKWIQLEMIQLNGFSSNYSGFRGKWIQRRSGE